MLAVVEQYLNRVRQSRGDSDIVQILAEISAGLGFRSAYLIEYGEGLKSARHIIDSHPGRAAWWQEYMASGMRTSTKAISELLNKGGVQVFTAERYASANDPMLALAAKYDIVECALVPISFGGAIVGLVGYSGNPVLSEAQQSALQLVSYTLFAQVRSFNATGLHAAPEALTPREREVIRLSADGLTSQEIARRLTMSPRTVNQHVDNVAAKLGTKNRAHTVAEAIRHNLLG